ncbi:MAG: right-handed parallel beta-helix repeat-containing protein [Planctomycetota bacterium]|jgi:parallel beta-helix repeat protein
MKAERTKRKLVLSLLALGSTLTFLAFCMAEDPDPGIPSGPVMQSDAQPIPNLPYTISESGSYCLTQNLIHTDESTNAIEVNADNVTIDLCGYSIIGPTTTHNETCSGIYMDGRKNVEIRNGTITNFPNDGISELDTGVVSEASGHRVINVRVTSIGAHGIVLWGSNHTVRDCTVTQTQISIEQGFGAITCGNMTTVIGNVVSENGIVGIRAGGGCMIRDNTLANCSFGIIPQSGSSVIDNTISFMVADGIWIRDVEGCLIKGNTLRGNERSGINVEAFDQWYQLWWGGSHWCLRWRWKYRSWDSSWQRSLNPGMDSFGPEKTSARSKLTYLLLTTASI